MRMPEQRYALRFAAALEAVSGLLLRSGRNGEFTDSTVETTGDRRLHINGYVWAGLLRRALARCESGKDLAAAWGKYDAQANGVAPLWTESFSLAEQDYLRAVNPGNRIDRQWGSVAPSALYSDELAFPQAPLWLRGTVFFSSRDEVDTAIQALLDAFSVIAQGIETIGGGWSYGFGRLLPLAVRWSVLGLQEKPARAQLWDPDFTAWQGVASGQEIDQRKPTVANGKEWSRIEVQAGIVEGQLLAIHTDVLELGTKLDGVMPDHYVFTRPALEQGTIIARPVVTGKAFRQAVLSREIERALRGTAGEGACLNSSDAKRSPVKTDGARRCACKRCFWFGDSEAGGIISVADALVVDPQIEIIHRIQACEHSRQTMQEKLFNGEYLTRGTFTFQILIDHSRQQATASRELEQKVRTLLEEMNPQSNHPAPPGWYRLGATSTCTGQLVVHAIKPEAEETPA
jgi:hypothetical protein